MLSNLNRRSPTSPIRSNRPPSRPQTPSSNSALKDSTNSPSQASFSLDQPPNGIASYRAFVTTWTDIHVAQWLTDARCSKVIPIFRDNHIRGDVVLDLDQNVLKEMGITSVGDRIKIMSAVKVLRQKCSRAGSAFGIGGANVLSGSSLNPRFLNGDTGSPSSRSFAGNSPPIQDASNGSRGSVSAGGRRSDKPPPIRIVQPGGGRDLPQIVSGNNTAGLAPPPSSAISILTPRPGAYQNSQTPSSGSGGSKQGSGSISRGHPPPPPSAASSRRGIIQPQHGREVTQPQVPSYADGPLPPPPEKPWEYGLPRAPTPGNLAGGSYAQPSGRASPTPGTTPHSRSGTSSSSLTHKKSGSLGGTMGNLIAGLKGTTWTSTSGQHPYAAADAGYAVGRGPFSGKGNDKAPLTLEDVRRRTIKIQLGEQGQPKSTRTIDISECDNGGEVLHTALRKFGKGAGLPEGSYGESESGSAGLVVDGWGVFLDGYGDPNGEFGPDRASPLLTCVVQVAL